MPASGPFSPAFLAALRREAGGRATVEADGLRRALLASGGDPERVREELLTGLAYLEARGELRLPARGGHGWDRGIAPAVPKSVRLTQAARPAPVRPWQGELWAPELAWVPGVGALTPEQHAFLRRVHGGLRAGAFAGHAPMKLRSLELTGHEKRLGEHERGALFGPGRLTLALLNCAPLAYLTHERVGPGGRALMFENKDAFVLALEAARASGQARFGIIIYGAGNGAPANAAHLLNIGVTEVHYAGDLDAAGVEIALRFALAAGALGVPVLPATAWQRAMLARARALTTQPVGAAQLSAEGLAWLGAGFGAEVDAALRAGQRASEECLGPADHTRLLLEETG